MKRLISVLVLFLSALAVSGQTSQGSRNTSVARVVGLADSLATRAKLSGDTFSGNVGVKTAPSVELDIAGSGKFSGDLDVYGESTLQGLTTLQGGLDVEGQAFFYEPVDFNDNVTGLTKSMVGLGNADNTSDANKPVSTAQQTALDLKLNIADLKYKGLWDANSNTPALAFGDPEPDGAFYIVSQEGTQDLGSGAKDYKYAEIVYFLNADGEWHNRDFGISDITGLQTALDLNLYRGLWDANANTPALAFGDPEPDGAFYIVSQEGTQDLGSGAKDYKYAEIVYFLNADGEWHNRDFGISDVTSLQDSLTAKQNKITGLTSNYLSKWNGSKLVNSLVYDNGTNVGIGTTSATAKVDIVGSSALLVNNNFVSTGGYNRYQNNGTNFGDVGSGNQVFSGGTLGDFGLSSRAGSLALGTSSLQRLTIIPTGNVGVGTTTPNAAAILETASTTKGVRFSPMTTTQRDAISSPPEGLLIYNLTTHTYDFYNGTIWVAF